MREIALDTETTGLDPNTGHRIVEIGCVEMINRIKTGKFFHAYINPQRDMPEEAFRVHGLSSTFLSDKPCFHEVIEELLAFIADSPLVIHNAAFDMRFLNAELGRASRELLILERAVDTVGMARQKFPGSPASLDALCRRFNVDSSARTKHGALLDAELLAEVYLELTGGRQSSLGLISQQSAVLQQYATRHAEIPYRQFAPSDEELSQHQGFIKKLKNAYWDTLFPADEAPAS